MVLQLVAPLAGGSQACFVLEQSFISGQPIRFVMLESGLFSEGAGNPSVSEINSREGNLSGSLVSPRDLSICPGRRRESSCAAVMESPTN